MAGGQFHAQVREINRPENKRKGFQDKKMETAVLRIKGSGKEFTGLVPEDAKINERIELIVKQNGGEIKKKYHDKMKTHEITEISIEDQLLTKIHWGIEGGKIPIAVDEEGNILGFLNGEEIKSKKIEVWKEESTLDPKHIEELWGNRRRVEGAHAGEREKEPDLKQNEIILFDKETGELTPMCPCREAESFDYREVSMERIFVSEISVVENKQNPVFENRSDEGMGEIFYSYIEIIDAKEDIIERVSVVSEPVEMPMAEAVGVVEQPVSADEGFSSPVTETEYTAQPIMIEPIPQAPKTRDLPPTPPDYFQNKQAVKKPEEIKLQKIKTVKQKLFRYPPKIEKIEIAEVKRTERYSVPAPVVEVPKTEIKVRKAEHKPECKRKRLLKKKVSKKRKRKRRKVIELAKKTSVKIKKIKAKIQKFIREKKKKRIKTKPRAKPVPKKKAKPKPKVKPVKRKKKKPKIKSQAKTKMKKQKNKKPKKKKNLRLEKPWKEVEKERNKRNNHKRLYQMLV